MSDLDLWIAAMIWAAIPYYKREADVPPAVRLYVDWIYAHAPERWADLTSRGKKEGGE